MFQYKQIGDNGVNILRDLKGNQPIPYNLLSTFSPIFFFLFDLSELPMFFALTLRLYNPDILSLIPLNHLSLACVPLVVLLLGQVIPLACLPRCYRWQCAQ